VWYGQRNGGGTIGPGTYSALVRATDRYGVTRTSPFLDTVTDLDTPFIPGPGGKIATDGLFTLNPDGSDVASLGSAQELGPAWSPDGTHIAFHMLGQLPHGYAADSIYVMSSDGNDRVDLTPNLTHGRPKATYPAWSPDGARIAYLQLVRRSTGQEHQDIEVMNSDGTGKVDITNGTIDVCLLCLDHLSWSPDGSWIAFPCHAICLIHPDGTGLRSLTRPGGENTTDWFPSWSPDGTEVAFTRNDYQACNGGTYCQSVWVVRVRGRLERDLSPDPLAVEEYPSWSPDGSRLVFFKQGSPSSLWTMNPTGGERVSINLPLTEPAWGAYP
jgi:TolB protein